MKGTKQVLISQQDNNEKNYNYVVGKVLNDQLKVSLSNSWVAVISKNIPQKALNLLFISYP